MTTSSFTDLDVWKRAHQVVLEVMRRSLTFPAIDKYGLTEQMRRAAVSMPANIAEGFGRHHPREKVHFYSISMGSARELEYYLILARDLEYLPTAPELSDQLVVVLKMLNALMTSIRVAHGLPFPS